MVLGIFTRGERVGKGGLWGELGYLTPPSNNPSQYVNVLVRMYTGCVYNWTKSFTCYEKKLKGGYSRQTPTKSYQKPFHPSQLSLMMKLLFRYIPNIDELDVEQLDRLNYYRGFPCAHGHTIRDSKKHWCYHCALKIQTNICGFDVNYLHRDYKIRYETLWRSIPQGGFDECWEVEEKKSRITFPSYRSLYTERFTEYVNVHKLIYQCAWGDVGSTWVTRTCKNPKCFNPLHMRSAWNQANPPKSISPFATEFQYEKLMLAGNRDRLNLPTDEPVSAQFKMPITNPQHNKKLKEVEE